MKIFLTWAFLIVGLHLFGQPLMGGYMSFTEYEVNKPTYAGNYFLVEKRSKAEIILGGGNDYKILSANKNIPQNTVKKRLWGVVKNDTLYLNAKMVTDIVWYSLVHELGRFDYVTFPFPIDKNIQYNLGLNYTHGTDVRSNSTGRMSGKKLATSRLPFVFDSDTGDLTYLTSESLFQLLKPNPDLQKRFDSEEDKLNPETIKQYLKELNESL